MMGWDKDRLKLAFKLGKCSGVTRLRELPSEGMFSQEVVSNFMYTGTCTLLHGYCMSSLAQNTWLRQRLAWEE